MTAILLFGVSTVAIVSPAAAQTAAETDRSGGQRARGRERLGEIVVTATKRASTIQDVPFSINAQTQEDIQRANATTIEDISRNVAGLAVQNLGPGQSQVSIRGVSAGQIVRDQPGVKEQVGVYLDESVISLSLFTPDFDLFDLNRVETLRGPQGTLFGSGSVGGTIRYITNQPKIGVTEGVVEANINDVADGDVGGHLKGAVNVPLGDTAALRAVGYYTKYAGFIDAHRAGGRQRTSMMAAQGRPGLDPVRAHAGDQHHAARGVSGNQGRRLQPPGGITTSISNQFTTTVGRRPRRARAISAAARKIRRQDLPRRPDREL